MSANRYLALASKLLNARIQHRHGESPVLLCLHLIPLSSPLSLPLPPPPVPLHLALCPQTSRIVMSRQCWWSIWAAASCTLHASAEERAALRARLFLRSHCVHAEKVLMDVPAVGKASIRSCSLP